MVFSPEEHDRRQMADLLYGLGYYGRSPNTYRKTSHMSIDITKRLVDAGMVETDPSNSKQARITAKGEKFIMDTRLAFFDIQTESQDKSIPTTMWLTMLGCIFIIVAAVVLAILTLGAK